MKESFESKCQSFIDHSQTIDNAYENLEDYNLTRKRSNSV